MANTFAESLKPAYIDREVLHKKYNPLLALVKELLGVIPNCDPLMEIWPPGFRTYNLLVPNMFNLPNTLFGNKSFKASMGLAMYASSKAACAYCTAHSCSFALRRGARKEAFDGEVTQKEQAVLTMAEKLASIPSLLTLDDVNAVKNHFSQSETEWLVFSISMMGFLNKFMDAMGIELEQEILNDSAELLLKTAWNPGKHANNGYHITESVQPQKDNLMTYLRVIRQAPGAVRWEKKWTKGVPSDYQQAAKYLNKHIGYSFPILKPVRQGRVIRTLTTILRDNLSNQQSITGIRIKMFATFIFSALVSNKILESEIKNMVTQLTPDINGEMHNELAKVSLLEIPEDQTGCEEMIKSLQPLFSEKEASAILLAIAASWSPAKVNDFVIKTATAHLEPAAIVEIIVWLSVLQLLNRLSSYYELMKAY